MGTAALTVGEMVVNRGIAATKLLLYCKKGRIVLTSWRISNFKSIRDTEPLSLRPLTVVCGPNSSGKSSLIKSILAVAQSLCSTAWDEPLVLNGHLVQLGSLEDVLHYGCPDRVIRLDCVVRSPSMQNICVLADFEVFEAKSSHDSRRLRVRVRRSKVSVTRDGKQEDWMVVERQNQPLPPAVLKADIAIPGLRAQLRAGIFDYTLVSPKPQELSSGQFLEEPLSASLQNFIPGRVLVRFRPRIRQVTQEIQQLVDLILAQADGRLPTKGIDLSQQISEDAKIAFQSISARLRTPNDQYERILREIGASRSLTVEQCLNLVDPLGRETVRDLSRRLSGAIPETQRRLARTEAERGPDTLEVQLFPTHYNTILDEIEQELGHRVKYLGPIRDDPRAIYAMPQLPNQRDVGLKGEFTAAMLDLYGGEEIRYPRPPLADGKIEIVTGTLKDAVRSWLAHIGMAEDVDTAETTKVGFQVSIRTPGLSKELDLTSVGVGVSQLLPTLVMPLMAPAHSTLIFEQPEVHLHPRVQSALADFFLGIIGCDKQCIVETHSEHLINRLRLRIAQDEGHKSLENIRIYFVERKEATSSFREVEPNEFGAIMDWPQGFFDEAEEEATELVRVQMARRRRVALDSRPNATTSSGE